MRLFSLGMAVSLAAVLSPLTAAADDIALVIAGSTDPSARRFPPTPITAPAIRALQDAGFRVVSGFAMHDSDMNGMVEQFAEDMDRADRVVVFVEGQMVSSSRDSWLVPFDAPRLNDINVGAYGLSLGAVMDLAAERPGSAVVFVAPSARETNIGRGLRDSVGDLPVPQGVTRITGPADSLMRFLEDDVLRPGRNASGAQISAPRGVVIDGYVPASGGLLSSGGPMFDGAGNEEDDYWRAVKDIGTTEAMMAYVQAYPNGRYVSEASRMVRDLRDEPMQRAQATESALNLSRDQRRAIQRNLTLLGFDTRGIDGVFGRGTRSAIADWQKQSNSDATGYLTRSQIDVMARAGEARARQLELEAKARQLEEDRQDRAFWEQTGRGTTEKGLRSYMQRYPDGLYSEIASARIREYDAQRGNSARKEEREEWDKAVNIHTVNSYKAYLQNYPQGNFAEIAQSRIQQLSNQEKNREVIKDAEAEEKQTIRNKMTGLLIEKRLETLGLEPGPTDGNFTPETRRAVRRFQRSRDLPVTGFVNRTTMIQLMTGQ